MKWIMFLLMCFPLFSLAQVFAPEGAHWYFPERNFASSKLGLVQFTNMGDTLIDGKLCQVIYKDNGTCNLSKGSYFTYMENNQLFYYDQILNVFRLFINFEAGVGDAWVMPVLGWENDSLKIHVDSISYLTLPSMDSLRVQHVRYFFKHFDECFSGFDKTEIIERIGFVNGLFPSIEFVSLCDGQWEGNIRCYEDLEIGLLQFDTVDCLFTTSIVKPLQATINISPNPADQFFRIYLDKIGRPLEFYLYTIYGQKLLTQSLHHNVTKVPTGYLPPGNYWYVVTQNGQLLKSGRLVILH